ncbi:putative pectinesterase 11 isoform X2 [Andrographis paniculata]|uniref:putative pectinesterase 11 isoform X2 n=1 Tax=Andrographis paniculata TaxID=175694 RepID=UPI0021E84315|nr:putative pectinesterase 11 isoform X2 [Andrographis paniculata]
MAMAMANNNTAVVIIIFIAFFVVDSDSSSSPPVLVEVDASGNGDYLKIQDAIDAAVPPNNSHHFFILVKPGIYREKILVPHDKPFVTLSGTNVSSSSPTVITWADSGDIFRSPTVSVFASDFVARFLTIQNSYGVGAKAVALRVSGDRAAFVGCRILSHQDTLLDERGRHYYLDSYIEGDIDFIFGNGASLFEKCHLHSVAEGNGGGAITAQRRQSPAEETGFTFLNCKVTGAAAGAALLGRPWGNYSRVVFARSYMSAAVGAQGWNDWGAPAKQRCWVQDCILRGVQMLRSRGEDRREGEMVAAAVGGRSGAVLDGGDDRRHVLD